MDFGQGWDSRDTALLIAALGATYADTETTKDLIARGGGETNPLLGRKPSGQDLDRDTIISGALGAALAGNLPPEQRKKMLGAWTGLEAGLAYKNQRVNPKGKKGKPTDFLHSGLEGPLTMAAAGYLLGGLTAKDGTVTLGLKADRDKKDIAALGPLLSFDMKF